MVGFGRRLHTSDQDNTAETWLVRSTLNPLLNERHFLSGQGRLVAVSKGLVVERLRSPDSNA
jgi:hypothetical protein